MGKTLAKVRHEQAMAVAFEFVSDWVSEIALRDNGRVFQAETLDHDVAFVTYGDLRRLMRNDQDIRERFMPQKGGE